MDFLSSMLPSIGISVFSGEDTFYADPSKSPWLSQMHGNLPTHLHAKILRVSPERGTMDVVGISEDVRLEVPFAYGDGAGEDFWGNFSMPTRGWHVLLARVGSDEYWPIRYRRPFDEDEGWSHAGTQEAQPGDFLFQGSELGGRLYAAQSGMVEMSSGPHAHLRFFPTEDDEYAEWVSRSAMLSTEAGQLSMEAPDEAGSLARVDLRGFFSSAKNKSYANLQLGTIGDTKDNIRGFLLEIIEEGVKGKSIVKGTQNALHLEGEKVFLGITEAKQNAVRGQVLEQRLLAIESKLNEIIQGFLLHTHASFGTPPVVVPPTATPIPYTASTETLLASSVFLP